MGKFLSIRLKKKKNMLLKSNAAVVLSCFSSNKSVKLMLYTSQYSTQREKNEIKIVAALTIKSQL